MSSKRPLIIIMFLTFVAISLLGILITRPHECDAEGTACSDGRLCPAHWVCCEQGCCAAPTQPSRRDDEIPRTEPIHSWYAQWPVLFLLGTLGGILMCCIWFLFFKRPTQYGVYVWQFACCVRRPPSERDSAGSVYPPPRYSRCSSFHQAPPPYSEVTSKPDLYPLVITCGEGEGKAGNYLMVQYFRNYVIRAPGSISAASTAESLNSSFICNAANEANSIIPPPYSCASNYEDCVGGGCGRSLLRSLSSLTEPRETRAPPPPRSHTAPDPVPPRRDTPSAFRQNLITSPVQPLDPAFDLELELIDCEMYCDGGCKPRLGPSPPAHRSPSNTEPMYDREAYGLRHLFACPSPEGAGACESPPQPTSPTQTSRDSTLRRPSDERHHRRLESVKKTSKARKSSLYMPLSVAYPVRPSRTSPGARASSRSAPATPCGALVPNLLTFTQRVSASRYGSRSSRCEEESNPLLADIEHEHSRADHKF
ncbi:uncharacterized protein LOC126367790 isoform X1 [Pectinophora gossypiella]|uniref:uncharacterized protein LOC126367790 isoform X1 n=1 Tax=Pectinophora gossypiella TaxID=13191 RepID=UPI00214E1AA1|nr:uncharacterized protein LOC126367790 isoform X1 [Pectinophora gossypiella]